MDNRAFSVGFKDSVTDCTFFQAMFQLKVVKVVNTFKLCYSICQKDSLEVDMKNSVFNKLLKVVPELNHDQ